MNHSIVEKIIRKANNVYKPLKRFIYKTDGTHSAKS